ncbi:RHS repeat protein, partial [Patescibacteria group bacterium]|nr:RHS repeat protein [Patescibacteria group bacterium]
MYRNWLYVFFLSLFFHINIYAENQEEKIIVSGPEQIATYSLDSELLIGNIISPISGNLNLSQTDLSSNVRQKIEVRKYYNPPFIPQSFHYNPYVNDYYLHQYLRNTYKGWEVFPHHKLKTYWKGNSLIITLPFSNGMTIDFYPSASEYSPAKLVSSSYGINNMVQESPSGKNDIRNTRIILNENNSKITVYEADGRQRYYYFIGLRPRHIEINSKYAILNDHEGFYLLEKEILPNGKMLKYSYQENQLSSIESTDHNGRVIYEKLDIKNIDNKPVNITDSQGKKVTYDYLAGNYEIKLKNKDSLEKEAKKILGLKYYSGYLPLLLNKSLTPFYQNEIILYNKGCLINEFYGKDQVFKCDYSVFGQQSPHYKINKIYFPVGLNDSFSCVYDIKYEPAEPGRRQGRTIVKNINGTTTVYSISKNLLITSVANMDENGILKKEKKFNWNDNGWINSIELFDGKDNRLYKKTFEYDSFGNPIKEFFTGVLSGSENEESYLIKRNYSQDGRNLLLEEENEEGLLTTYQYVPSTDLLLEKTLKDKNSDLIFLHEVNEYDEFNNLIKNSIDYENGESKITRYHLRQKQPFLHMIDVIEEKYREGIQEKFLMKKHFSYDKWGNVSKEDIYDENGQFVYSINRKFNERGDLLSETDPLGNIANYSYDEKGRRITSKSFSNKINTKYHYDLTGRIKAKEERGQDNIIHCKSYVYDENDNLISKKDIYGNSIKYKFDPV